jgi:hypothetical protein
MKNSVIHFCKNGIKQMRFKLKALRRVLLYPWRFLKNVWLFRKELWNFRQWDYCFNNRLYARSWELTAEYLDSDTCITGSGHEDAANIRNFIKLLRLSEDGVTEAERIMGIDFFEQSKLADGDEGCLSSWLSRPKETWDEEQRKFYKMLMLMNQIEKKSWKNAWKFMSSHGQGWWE